MSHIFGEELNRLDHHRVITFENLMYELIVCQGILNSVIGKRVHDSAGIRKRPTAASFQEHDISLRFRWKKHRGIDLIERLAEQVKHLLHENTSVRSQDCKSDRISPADFQVTENSLRSPSVAAPDWTMNGTFS